ncbi:MAG: RNA methyltransferase [Deltaproteobacteria bacterium]|nr:RNA methyltransferase [Deltaproteobacteria bacterium]
MRNAEFPLPISFRIHHSELRIRKMITSKGNLRIKEIRLLKQAKHRHARGEYFIEGMRLVEDALQHPEQFRKIIYSSRLEEKARGAALLSAARKKIQEAEWLYVNDEVMGSVCDTQNHQGILAVLKMKEGSFAEICQREGIIVLLAGLQDPGNLGTILRVAEAGAAAGVILSKETIDPYNPKVVRASMGSFFRLPFLPDQDMGNSLKNLRSRGWRILATAVHGGPSFWEVDFSKPTAVLFGQEGTGLPSRLLEGADGLLTIPMTPGVDSLNVGMAAGLIIYEAWRQKKIDKQFDL